MRCCICGEDMRGKPVMQDKMIGVMYCPKHSDYFHALKDPSSFSSCHNCGFKYSKAHSQFAQGDVQKCPNCGISLKLTEGTADKLVIELGAKEKKDIHAEAQQMRSNDHARRVMGQTTKERRQYALKEVFAEWSGVKVRSMTSVKNIQSSIEAEDSILTMIIDLASASKTDLEEIKRVSQIPGYQPTVGDQFFNILLGLKVSLFQRIPNKDDRKTRHVVFDI